MGCWPAAFLFLFCAIFLVVKEKSGKPLFKQVEETTVAKPAEPATTEMASAKA